MKHIIAGLLSLAALSAQAQTGPIKIGEINSYSSMPQFTTPYRQGWQLALDEVNASGGLLGRQVLVIARDDGGRPEEALRHALELTSLEKVDVLAGGFLSNVGLALADYAAKNKRLYVASEPLTDAIVWEKGNRYTFRLRPSTYMQAAMLVEEAAKLPAKRWATLAPNYEYGQSAVASFKTLLKAKRPDVEFVAEQWPALGKLEAGSTLQALMQAKPDAIFNVTFGADLAKLVREGNQRNIFPKTPVVSMLSGEPEYLDVLKDETPRGWIVTGYPWTRLTAASTPRLPPTITKNSTRTRRSARWSATRLCRRFLPLSKRPKAPTTKNWLLPCAASSSAPRLARPSSARWTSNPPWARLSASSTSAGARARWCSGAMLTARLTCLLMIL